MSRWALGLIETRGLVGAIEAADAAAKAAAVVVASAELTSGTLMTLRIEGELGAVQAAVEAGARAAQAVGEIVAVTIIPNPDDGLIAIMPHLRYVSEYHPGEDRPPLLLYGGDPVPPKSPRPPRRRPPQTGASVTKKAGDDEKPSSKDLSHMTVVELRRFARSLSRMDIKGREISRANKTQLIEAIKRIIDMD